MRRWMALSLMTLVVTTSAFAQDARLKRMDTMELGRAWEAVGRLDIDGRGFCTGALIAPDLVLTAAHCLYEKRSGDRIDHDKVEFLAGWRNGRASAYRRVRRAVTHPDYVYSEQVSAKRVRNDLALLELDQPIRLPQVRPFGTAARPSTGDSVGVVSYATGRSEAPSLQEVCTVLSRQDGVLITSCTVDFGASGAPIFTFISGEAQIVSVVSAKAEFEGETISIGTGLGEPLAELRGQLIAGQGASLPGEGRARVGEVRRKTGAKFVKP